MKEYEVTLKKVIHIIAESEEDARREVESFCEMDIADVKEVES